MPEKKQPLSLDDAKVFVLRSLSWRPKEVCVVQSNRRTGKYEFMVGPIPGGRFVGVFTKSIKPRELLDDGLDAVDK